MNEQQSRFIVPIIIAFAAAALTFVPMPDGGVRIIQVVWLVVGFDNLAVAALAHGLVLGGIAYLVVWWSKRRHWTVDGAFVAVMLFAGYVAAYFAVGFPIVA